MNNEITNNEITDEIKSIINNVPVKQVMVQCSPVKIFKQPLHPKYIQRVPKPIIIENKVENVKEKTNNIIDEQTNNIKNKFDKHHLLKAKMKR